MRYAIVQNGIVTNVVLAESALNDSFIASETANIGDVYADGLFITPMVKVVPATVTPAQFRLALNTLNLRDMVEQAVQSSDRNTQDMWEYSVAIDRNNALLCAMAEQLNISEEQLDNVFILAGAL